MVEAVGRDRHWLSVTVQKFLKYLALGWIKGELRTARVNPGGKN